MRGQHYRIPADPIQEEIRDFFWRNDANLKQLLYSKEELTQFWKRTLMLEGLEAEKGATEDSRWLDVMLTR